MHTLNTNDDSRVLMQNDIALDEGSSSAGNYDYELKSRELKGDCLDADGKAYQYVSKNVRVDDDECSKTDTLEECKTICEGKPQLEKQVGFSHRFFRIFNDIFTSDECKSECYCYYDNSAASAGDFTPSGGQEGSGPVASGTGGSRTCYPNQVSPLSHAL